MLKKILSKWKNFFASLVQTLNNVILGWTQTVTLFLIILVLFFPFYFKKLSNFTYKKRKKFYLQQVEKKKFFKKYLLLKENIKGDNIYYKGKTDNDFIILFNDILQKQGAININIQFLTERKIKVENVREKRLQVKSFMKFSDLLKTIEFFEKMRPFVFIEELKVILPDVRKKSIVSLEDAVTPFLTVKMIMLVFTKNV